MVNRGPMVVCGEHLVCVDVDIMVCILMDENDINDHEIRTFYFVNCFSVENVNFVGQIEDRVQTRHECSTK